MPRNVSTCQSSRNGGAEDIGASAATAERTVGLRMTRPFFINFLTATRLFATAISGASLGSSLRAKTGGSTHAHEHA